MMRQSARVRSHMFGGPTTPVGCSHMTADMHRDPTNAVIHRLHRHCNRGLAHWAGPDKDKTTTCSRVVSVASVLSVNSAVFDTEIKQSVDPLHIYRNILRKQHGRYHCCVLMVYLWAPTSVWKTPLGHKKGVPAVVERGNSLVICNRRFRTSKAYFRTSRWNRRVYRRAGIRQRMDHTIAPRRSCEAEREAWRYLDRSVVHRPNASRDHESPPKYGEDL